MRRCCSLYSIKRLIIYHFKCEKQLKKQCNFVLLNLNYIFYIFKCINIFIFSIFNWIVAKS